MSCLGRTEPSICFAPRQRDAYAETALSLEEALSCGFGSQVIPTGLKV